MTVFRCIFSPTSCVSSVAKSTTNDLFNALTSWIVASVRWFLGAVGRVLVSASEPSTVLNGAKAEFTTLLVLAPLLMMIGLLVSTLQALRHGEASSLWRVYLGVAPACVAGVALAQPLASLTLQAVNQMSSTAASSVAQHETTLARAMAGLTPNAPGFATFLLAAFVVIGAMLLWCELIVRTVVLTLLLVLVPVVVPLSTFPALRRLSWRLVETFLAVAASKFIIVVSLVLGLNELQGSSATEVITGAVTLLLATCTPFLLLRVIPFIEQSALHHLEGLRSRATRAVTNAPSSPVAQVARSLAPEVPVPGPPERSEDLGLGTWPGTPPSPMPSFDGDPPPPPIGTPRPRGGHVAYRRDEVGPVVGWHFDE
ncbi:MAG TPA: type IV secretion system protein [Acidimicrobiales bacterium]|nr:type IV secretion system protein [Acidimicrobiales bacterium]